ncbi:methyl-accepting chemotaxis protein [Varunaivibrio sulfuroxidans]|uniref:PAS domain-containing protein n=1 Tax=Varunaivibrio sulfuroxidans TaxID=1773489 RepID=A0A4R3J3F7_9PROT|nr:methyl-accepting chemotaxis protein [Varunaivibrio sulfuroxidans]TCS60369.1 PAS domain-containing protein [Varunaivibrio sulfuroxidans]WES30943.1 methyl-accepting chemotaxis protein [Varunaivibrio sulfuroxidans]
MLRSRLLKTKHFESMIGHMPVGVMVLDPRDLCIRYMNEAGRRTFEGLQHLFPEKPDKMIGRSIDFLGDIQEIRRIRGGGEAQLPQQVRVTLGEKCLNLVFSALRDDAGRYIAPMMTWAHTDTPGAEDVAPPPLQRMLEQMPINVMAIDIATFAITYANATSIETLRDLEHLLPCKAENIVGQCIDIFHKNPSHQRAILSDPANLPHHATITLGEETLDLRVSAFFDDAGVYTGAMLTWSVITKRVEQAHSFEQNIGTVVNEVGDASETLQATAISMADTVEEAQGQASSVEEAAQHLSASVQEISRHVTRSTELTAQAVENANHSNTMIQGLAEAAKKIGDVVNLINDIASQTNLLALNATIEAARAGEAGKGFAVVASEVKNLATQTAKATEEISAQIGGIQSATHEAVEAIEGIGGTIRELNEIGATLAEAIDEQRKTSQSVTDHIAAVGATSEESGNAADQVLERASALSEQSVRLKSEVDAFLFELRRNDDGKKREAPSGVFPHPSPSDGQPESPQAPPDVTHPSRDAHPGVAGKAQPDADGDMSEAPRDDSLNRGPFSIEQINAVRSSFALLEEHFDAVADGFYRRLFEIDPNLENLFKFGPQQQAQRLLSLLKSIVANLDRVDTLLPDIEELGRKHGQGDISAADYESFKESLMWTLETFLGAQFTPEARDSWETVYDTLASTMKYAQS